jgi:DNA polymerase-3 subunit delta'
VPILPLHGHTALRQRLAEATGRGTLPGSLLLHGPRGVGKQRLALWLGQLLLCGASEDDRPCGSCQGCRYALELTHPDLQWYFPRPRPRDSDLDADEIRADYGEARAERAAAQGLYAPPSGAEAIFVSTVRAIVRSAALSPALGRRKVFVLGDAERMVPQEGADQAANAFLKLLEEPPADTTLVLTSSEPGSLLPTVRSRVVAIRVGHMSEADVRTFLAEPTVAAALDSLDLPRSIDQRAQLAGGAPGNLFDSAGRREALNQARRLLDASVSSDRAAALRGAFIQGGSRARGAFADTLDMLTMLLHQRSRLAAERSDERDATGSARAIAMVERAKELATGNVNPQLISAWLVRDIGAALQ